MRRGFLYNSLPSGGVHLAFPEWCDFLIIPGKPVQRQPDAVFREEVGDILEQDVDVAGEETGFGTGGATFEDIELFKKHIGSNVKIKAAGGVSTIEDLEKFIELGCERVGTSRAVGLLKPNR